MSLHRRLMMQQISTPPGPLPPEYQQVEYLGVTGVQLITLPFPKTGRSICELNFDADNGGPYSIFGDIFNGNQWQYFIGKIGSTLSLYINGGREYQYSVGYGQHHLIVQDYDDKTVCIDNDIEYVAQSSIFPLTTTRNLGLITPFAIGNWQGFWGKLGICEYQDTANHVRLIPCYRKSDNEPGMYDIVNGAFYTNSGGGSFTVGPDI